MVQLPLSTSGQTSCWIAHKARAPRPGYRLGSRRMSKAIASRSQQLPVADHHICGQGHQASSSTTESRDPRWVRILGRGVGRGRRVLSVRACCGMLESTLAPRPRSRVPMCQDAWYTELPSVPSCTTQVETLSSHDTFRHRSCLCSYSSIGRHRCFSCCRPLMSRTMASQLHYNSHTFTHCHCILQW